MFLPREEEKYWKDRDPIKLFSEKMIKAGVLTEQECINLDKEVVSEIDNAVKFAIESPDPEPGELYEDLYA